MGGRGQVLSTRAVFPPMVRMQKEPEEQEPKYIQGAPLVCSVWKPSEEIEPRRRQWPTQRDVAELIDY